MAEMAPLPLLEKLVNRKITRVRCLPVQANTQVPAMLLIDTEDGTSIVIKIDNGFEMHIGTQTGDWDSWTP